MITIQDLDTRDFRALKRVVAEMQIQISEGKIISDSSLNQSLEILNDYICRIEVNIMCLKNQARDRSRILRQTANNINRRKYESSQIRGFIGKEF